MQLKISNFNFITFEGIDGSGKTTQSKMLYDYLQKKSIESIWTREIGGTPICEKIRDITVNNDLDKISELFLIFAARNEHINNIIKPALDNNKIVICDRYVDSTASYQVCKKLSIDNIYNLHNEYLENFMPSLTFYIDISYEIAQKRIKSRLVNNKFDNLDSVFFHSLKNNYEEIIKKFPNRFIKIDGNNDVNSIHNKILKYLNLA